MPASPPTRSSREAKVLDRLMHWENVPELVDPFRTPVQVAASLGYASVVHELCRSRMARPEEAIHFAAEKGHSDTCRVLVSFSMPERDILGILDAAGRTAAGAAREAGHEELARELSPLT
jgi:hypothetical protein